MGPKFKKINMNKNAAKILKACKNKFGANKDNCNKFAIAVAAEFKIELKTNQNNSIILECWSYSALCKGKKLDYLCS